MPSRDLLKRFARCGLIPYTETDFYRKAHEAAQAEALDRNGAEYPGVKTVSRVQEIET